MLLNDAGRAADNTDLPLRISAESHYSVMDKRDRPDNPQALDR